MDPSREKPIQDDKPTSSLGPVPVPSREVTELARAGNRLEAIRRHRELTGASVEQATEAVREL